MAPGGCLKFFMLISFFSLSLFGINSRSKTLYRGKADGSHYLYRFFCEKNAELERCSLSAARLNSKTCNLEVYDLISDKITAQNNGQHTFVNSNVCVARTTHVTKKSLIVHVRKVNEDEICEGAKDFRWEFKAVSFEDFKMPNHGCKDLKVIL